MKAGEITLEKWRRLYGLADELKQLRPWEWMWDDDSFGVEDPETGEVGYACVMGHGGEHYALAFYRGSEGLAGYLQVRDGEVGADAPDALHCQDCLMVSFEDRDYLQPRDRAIIKQLGLKFRGVNAWPVFRDWKPGYFPWFIEPDAARRLIEMIPQALDVARRYRDNQSLLDAPEPGAYLVRVPEPGTEGPVWSDQWRAPTPLPATEFSAPAPDPGSLEELRRSSKIRPGEWEVDYYYASMPVKEKGVRPYYPRMLLAVDRRSGMILFFHLCPKNTDWAEEFNAVFLKKLREMKVRPSRILVSKNGYALFQAIAAGLGIEIKVVKNLGAINEFRAQLEQFTQG